MNRFQRIYSLKRLLAYRASAPVMANSIGAQEDSPKISNQFDGTLLFKPKQQLMELEGRLLFDAAAGVTGLDLGFDALDDAGLDGGDDDADVLDPAITAILNDALDFSTTLNSKTIVFVDSAVSDLSGFINASDPNLEFFLLAANEDGIGQIADSLAGRTDVSSIHIISHGEAGALMLGSSTLSRGDLSNYSTELAIIGDALSNDGDILIYGCNVAEGQVGQKFIQSLSKMTGADIAASSDWTGDEGQGGDWDLEVSVGEVDIDAIFGADGDIGYDNLLAAPTITAPTAVTAIEDTAYDFLTLATLSPTVSVYDADNDNLLVTLNVSNGTMDLVAAAPVLMTGNGTSIITMFGSFADINSNLATLSYTGDLDFVGTDTLSITTDDATSVAVSNTTITISPVNDAPQIVFPVSQNIIEDTQTLIAGLSISDVDDNAGLLTVDLSVVNGTLDINSTGITVTYRSAGGDALTLSGTKAALNSALATLAYKPTQDFVGADALAITVNDNGNVGAGGSLTDMNVVGLVVTHVNDAPVLSAPAGGYDVYGETPTALAGLSINDVDQLAASNMTLTISVANGFLSYLGALAPTSGNPAGDLSFEFTGTQSALNLVLSQLSYTGGIGFVGADQIQVQVQDDDASGFGASQFSNDGVDIVVHPKNEADFNISDTDPIGTSLDLIDDLTTSNGLDNISFPPPKLTVASGIGEFRVYNDSEPVRAIVEGREDDFGAANGSTTAETPVRSGLALDEEQRDFRANVLSPTGLGDNLNSDNDLNVEAEDSAEKSDDTGPKPDKAMAAPAAAEGATNDTETTSPSDALKLSADEFDRNVDQLLDDLGTPSSSRDE